MFFPSGWIECVVVQFYLWIKLYFLLFQTQYHTLPYTITKENKIQTKDKIHVYLYHINHYTDIPFHRSTQLLQLKVPSVKPSCAFYKRCEGLARAVVVAGGTMQPVNIRFITFRIL